MSSESNRLSTSSTAESKSFSRKGRRRAREAVAQAIYVWIWQNDNDTRLLEASLFDKGDLNGVDLEHYRKCLKGTQDLEQDLKRIVEPFLDIDIEEVRDIEMAMLLAGSYELLECEEIPQSVVINEWVEVAKSLGSVASSYQFINAILHKVAKSVENE